jgi:hypothetical protein
MTINQKRFIINGIDSTNHYYTECIRVNYKIVQLFIGRSFIFNSLVL